MRLRNTDIALVALGALAAFVLVLFMTPNGVRIWSPDAIYYWDAAQHLAQAHGLSVVNYEAKATDLTQPLTHFPPLISVATAWIPPRLVNAAACAATAALVMIAALRFSASTIAALIAFALFCASDLLMWTALYSSEPVFFAFVMLAVWACAEYSRSSDYRWLAVACAAGALSSLTRYVGIATFGWVALVTWRTGAVNARWRVTSLALTVSSAPLALWLLRNSLLGVAGVDRGVRLVSPGGALVTVGPALTRWVADPALPSHLAIAELVAFMAIILLGWRTLMKRTSLTTAAAGFVAVYLTVVLTAVATIEPTTQLDIRTLAVVHVVAIPVFAVWLAAPQSRAVRGAAVLFTAAVVLGGVRTANFYRHQPLYVREPSPLWDAVAAVPTGTALYSNYPELVWYRMQRRAFAVTENGPPPSGAFLLTIAHMSDRPKFPLFRAVTARWPQRAVIETVDGTLAQVTP